MAAFTLAGLGACSPQPQSGDVVESPPSKVAFAEMTEEVRIEFAGCELLIEHEGCFLVGASSFRLWLADPAAYQWQVSLGTRPVDLAREGAAAQGGILLTLQPSALPSTLRVASNRGPGLVMPLLRLPQYPWQSEVEQARQVKDLEQALRHVEAALQSMDARAAADAHERAALLGRRARLQLQRGDWPRTRATLEQSIALARTAGLTSQASDDLAMLGFLLLTRDDDVAAVSRLLDDTPAASAVDAVSRMRIDNLRGALEHAGGNLLAAEAAYRRALQSAERTQSLTHIATARVGLSQVLAELGDFGAAQRMLAELSPVTLDALSHCDRGRAHNTRAWIALLANEAKTGTADPTADLLAARSLFKEKCTHALADLSNLTLNQALDALQRGDLDRASSALDEARRLEPEPPSVQRAWQLEIEARIALAAGRAEQALRLFRELGMRAAAMATAEYRWRAALGEAEALQFLRQDAAAIEAYQRADATLSEAVKRTPTTDGRALLLARAERLPSRYIQALMDLNRPEEALALARKYRNEPLRRVHEANRLAALGGEQRARYQRLLVEHRSLRQALEQRTQGDWALPADELRQAQEARRPAHDRLHELTQRIAAFGQEIDPGLGPTGTRDGELSLLFFPLEDDWAAFAFNREQVQARRLSGLDLKSAPEALAHALIEPFQDALDGVERLRILAYGPLRELDFHRLRWRGTPLGERLTVVYVADLGEVPVDSRADTLLLVADPGGDLPAARREARAIDALYGAHAPAIRIELLLGDAASTRSVLSALSRATFFHYAGHTEIPPQASFGPRFALAHGAALGLGDVLSLPRVPRFAVLAACEGATSTLGVAAESLSLAHALLARGAESVVAAPRPVDDRVAAELSAELHRRRMQGDSLEHAFTGAVRALHAQWPESDWSAFRLYTRF